MSRIHVVLGLFACALTTVSAAPLSAQLAKVIYSDIATSSTSDVPGLGGAKFSSFDRPYRSPNGAFWIISADTDLATTIDEVILLGSGSTGTVVVQEGVTQVAPPSVELAGLIDRNLFVTNSGDLAFATNTDGATTQDEVIGRRLGGVFDTPIREGNSAPGILGATLGTSVHSAYISDNGTVGFVGTGLQGVPTTNDSAVFFGNSVIAQEGLTAPTGQAGGATNTWQLFDFEDTYFAKNGTRHLIRGDTDAATTADDILVYNGSVVLQEGEVVPGSGFVSPIASGGPTESLMTASGDWFARGGNADGVDWVVMNGNVLAATGDSVPGGLLGEAFDDNIFSATFFSMTANSRGDFVIGGVTDAIDIAANAVLVYNNKYVLMREGDAIDLDGNGLADDNAFISVFNNEDAFLTNDRWYYFTADLRDGAGVALGQAFLSVRAIPEPSAVWMAACGLLALVGRRQRRA